MRKTINPPIAGQPLSVSFARELCAGVNAGRIIAGKNIRVEYKPNGTVVHAKSTAGGGGSQPQTFDNGCFAIAGVNAETGELSLKNCYWRHANRCHEVDSGLVQSWKGCIIALQISETNHNFLQSEIVAFQNFDSLQSAQKNIAYSVIPLYKFDENGKVEVDFRNTPTSVAWEESMDGEEDSTY